MRDIAHFWCKDADLFDFIMRIRAHHQNALALFHHTIDNAHQNDDAQISIIPAIHQQSLQGRSLITLGGWQTCDYGFQHKINAYARLCRNWHSIGSIKADHILDLLFDAIRLCGGQINLIEHRHNFMAGIEGLIDIGKGLRFNALRGIDNKQRAFTGCQRARDFIGKVHMAGRVHQIEDIILTILGPVIEAHGLGLDGDAAFTLDIHGIKHLLNHIAFCQAACRLNQTIRQRRLAVVDMRHNGEIANIVERMPSHGREIAFMGRRGKG